MGGGQPPLLVELQLALLFFSVYMAEKAWSYVGSKLIGNLFAGVLLGPAVFNIVPFVPSLRMLGKLGVMLLVTKSGTEVDLPTAKKVGGRAVVAAVLGVLFPVLLCMAVMCLLFRKSWTTGLAVGAAIAPTSLGFSVKLLDEFGRVQTPLGQLICTAAVVDDVISLTLLAEIRALKTANPSAWTLAQPVVASALSLFLGALAAVYLPRHIQRCTQKLFGEETRGRFQLLLLLLLSLLLAWLCALVGSSELLGSFLAGLLFSACPECDEEWTRRVGRITGWGTRLFFAATIGFGVPALFTEGGLFTPDALARGALLSVCAIVGKLFSGLMATPFSVLTVMQLGWGMQGRGEFSFLIADEAATEGILSAVDYSATIWALLVSSVTAPFVFKCLLARDKQIATEESSQQAAHFDDPVPVLEPSKEEDAAATNSRSSKENAERSSKEEDAKRPSKVNAATTNKRPSKGMGDNTTTDIHSETGRASPTVIHVDNHASLPLQT